MFRLKSWLVIASTIGLASGCASTSAPPTKMRSPLANAASVSPALAANRDLQRLPIVPADEISPAAASDARQKFVSSAKPNVIQIGEVERLAATDKASASKHDIQLVSAQKFDPDPVPRPPVVSGPTPPVVSQNSEILPPAVASRRRPAYALEETFPIDLPNVVRLVDSNSPLIGYASARVNEAFAATRLAELQWLPSLMAGTMYNRYDGETQNQQGLMFNVSRSNLYNAGALGLNLNTADAIYSPLIARRLLSSAQLRVTASVQTSELDAVLAYFDLVQIHAQLAINAESLAKGEQMLQAAINAKQAQLDRTAGDVNRARAEVLLRRQERLDLQGRSGAASARLAKLLMLDPHIKLVPIGREVVPITLIGDDLSLAELIGIAIETRPDFAANREVLAAAWERVRKAERTPFLPKLALQETGGQFGGGTDATLSQFQARNVITAQVLWELKNLGFGNRQETNAQRALASQAEFQLAELRARLMSEVVESAQVAAAKYESLDLSDQAVKEATELYRIAREGTFNVIDAKNLFDALRPLIAIQTLNTAQLNYLGAVVDFNRAQFRLYTALGCPPGLVDPSHTDTLQNNAPPLPQPPNN